MIEFNSNLELDDIIQKNDLVLVDFWATWCGPCRMLLPILDKVDTQLEKLTVVTINVDEFNELAAEHGVRSVPTLILFRNGAEVASHSGFVSSNNLIDWINDN